MGASTKGERKIGARVALHWLKKAAVGIAVLDLILAINDSRNVGRFFLLITLSSTFDISPENVIRDHCRENVEGICETYAQFAILGTSSNKPGLRSYISSSGGGGIGNTGEGPSYFGTKLSHKLLPEIFKELVMSWKSTFDQSRSNANISFLFDDDRMPGIHKSNSFSQQQQEAYLRENGRESISATKNHHQSHLNSYGLHHDSTSGSIPSVPSASLFSSNSPSSSRPLGRKKRAVLSNRENDETGNIFETTSEKILQHANTVPLNYVPSTSTSATSTSISAADKPGTGSSSMHNEITPASTKKVLSSSIPSTTVHISSSSSSTGGTLDETITTTTTATTTKGSKTEKVKSSSKPIANPEQPGKSLTTGEKMNRIGSDQTARGSNNSIRNKSSSKGSLLERDFGKMRIGLGPKQIIGFLQEEMFTRWPFLLENLETLLKERNMSSEEQLDLPEAKKIKMHIQVRPFGPNPFKDSKQRLKATQQILFDYPWLTMYQLYPKLSGAFTKMFLVISVYTWIWGTVIALMLLIGTYTEDQTTLHGWIIFNILYSFFLFMIEDWIHSNIDPERSSVSVWLFIMYSLYKPLAAWIGFTQWSEMKKIVSLETTTSGSVTTDHYLNSRANASSRPVLLVPSSPSVSSEGTTKDTTVVEIITPSKNTLLVSTLAEAQSQSQDPCFGDNSPAEDYEELDEDDEDDEEEDDDETDDDDSDGDLNDFEKREENDTGVEG